MTASFLGTALSSSAPVEVTICFSSTCKEDPGSARKGLEQGTHAYIDIGQRRGLRAGGQNDVLGGQLLLAA